MGKGKYSPLLTAVDKYIIKDSLEMFKMQEIYNALPGYDTEKSVRIRRQCKGAP